MCKVEEIKRRGGAVVEYAQPQISPIPTVSTN
jgi:hypothetical protein